MFGKRSVLKRLRKLLVNAEIEEQVDERIEQLRKEGNPLWYMKGTCPYCLSAGEPSEEDLGGMKNDLMYVNFGKFSFQICKYHLVWLHDCIEEHIINEQSAEREEEALALSIAAWNEWYGGEEGERDI